ncbi:MAG: histidine phosphatase family protein [Bacteroidota bacterium]
MKNTLFLIRHSFAENAFDTSDFERTLTTEGFKYARLTGEFLKEEKFKPDTVLTSPATRTKQTAETFSEVVGFSMQLVQFAEVIYNASVRELLELVNGIDPGAKHVAIIGHNPTITYFSEYLTGEEIASISPSGVVKISFDKIKWGEISQRSGKFIKYFHPDHVQS